MSQGEVSGRTAFQAEGTAAVKSLRQKWAQRGEGRPACRWQRKWHPNLRPGLLPLHSVRPIGVHASRTKTLALGGSNGASSGRGGWYKRKLKLLHQERVLVRRPPALSHRDHAGLDSWGPGGWGSGGRSMEATSLATEAPCERAQRSIESPPHPGPWPQPHGTTRVRRPGLCPGM